MIETDLHKNIVQTAKTLNVPLHLDHLPTTPPGLEALAEKKIVLVGDGLDVLAAFLAPLMVATEGEAGFVLQNTQSKDQTVEEILSKDPDVVLLDEYLRGFRGHLLIEPLHQRKPGLICIGFSNAPSAESIFREQKAGFVLKETEDPWRTLAALARAIGT